MKYPILLKEAKKKVIIQYNVDVGVGVGWGGWEGYRRR